MSQSELKVAKLTREELERRLLKLEGAYQECQRLSLSNDFAAAVMHEVNNPLEAITNLVYLAQDEITSSEERQRYLNLVQEQLIVLASVARSSLAFYRGQDETRDINLMDIAESALKLHFRRLHQGSVKVSTEYCGNTSCSAIGSEILQVISNLILNAADALADTSEASLTITVRRTKSMLQLSIRDNGPGVPEHLEKSLFEAHATGKKTGTGMGLWLSRCIVTKHGGTLCFRTSRAAGKSGTLFRMALPAHPAAARPKQRL